MVSFGVGFTGISGSGFTGIGGGSTGIGAGITGIGGMGGLNYIGEVPYITVIAPPDDRYLPGFSELQADGDRIYQAPRLKEEALAVQFSLYGLPIPITFGVRRLGGNMIYAQPLKEVVTTDKERGKGGGPVSKTIGYEYFATFAISFGFADTSLTGKKVIRIWADGHLIYDRRGIGRIALDERVRFNFYPGSETQMPDKVIEADKTIGTGNAPAYRGLMYIVFDSLPLEFFGNRIPTINVEIGDATEQTTTSFLMSDPLEGEPNGQVINVDWDNQVLYAGAGLTNQYDLATNEYIGYTDTSAASYTCMTYDKENGWLVGNSSTLYIYMPLVVMDADTGAVLGSYGVASNINTGGTMRQARIILPIKVITPLLPQYGYVVCSVYNTVEFVDVHPESPDELFGSHSILGGTDYSGFTINSIRSACVGNSQLGVTEFFVGVQGFGIQKYALYNTGDTSGTDVETWLSDGDADNEPVGMIYDEADNGLIVLWYNHDTEIKSIIKYDATTKEVLWTIDDIDYNTSNIGRNWWQSDITLGSMGLVQSGISDLSVYSINVVTGEYDSFELASGLYFVGATVFDSKTNSIMGKRINNTIGREYYDRLSDIRTTIKAFLEFAASVAGFTVDSNFFVDSSIDDAIDGAKITTRVSFKSLLDTLGAVYRFDRIENGDAIFLVRKSTTFSGDYDFELSTTDLIPGTGSASVVGRRESDIDLPISIELTHLDKRIGYNPNTQVARRTGFPVATTDASDTLSLSIPIIITGTEALRLATLMLYGAWKTKTGFQFMTDYSYVDLNPGDIGVLNDGDLEYVVKITEASINANWTVTFKANTFLVDSPISVEAEEPEVWVQEVIGFSSTGVVPLDIPLLRPQDNGVSYADSYYYPVYSIAYGLARSGWRGGETYFGTDPLDYQKVSENVTQPFIGKVGNIPDDIEDPFSTDTENTLSVRASYNPDLLVSITDEEMFGYNNVFAYGAHGRWEIIQFRDVVHEDDGSYTLSHLYRGRFNTDGNCNNHALADKLIMLDPSWVRLNGVSTTFLHETLFYKGVSFGQNPYNGKVKTINWSGESIRPPSPVNLKAHLDAEGNAVFTWVRRTRGKDSWDDNGSEEIPWFETGTLGFRIYFYGSSSADTELAYRDSDNLASVSAYDPYTCTLSPAEQTTIFGSTIDNTIVNIGVKMYSSVPGVFGHERREDLYVGLPDTYIVPLSHVTDLSDLTTYSMTMPSINNEDGDLIIAVQIGTLSGATVSSVSCVDGGSPSVAVQADRTGMALGIFKIDNAVNNGSSGFDLTVNLSSTATYCSIYAWKVRTEDPSPKGVASGSGTTSNVTDGLDCASGGFVVSVGMRNSTSGSISQSWDGDGTLDEEINTNVYIHKVVFADIKLSASDEEGATFTQTTSPAAAQLFAAASFK